VHIECTEKGKTKQKQNERKQKRKKENPRAPHSSIFTKLAENYRADRKRETRTLSEQLRATFPWLD